MTHKKTKIDTSKENGKTTPAIGGQQKTLTMGGQQTTLATGDKTKGMGGKAFPPLGMTVLPVGSSSQARQTSTLHNNVIAA